MALDKPRRRTLVTGDSLPALTTEYQEISVLPPAEEDVDLHAGAVRAFTVNIRNRATTSVFLKEGEGDEIEIARGENYPIYEPSGISSVSLKGASGSETVELRVVVAHNDFSLRDKIDGFLWSLSQYVGTATRDTVITGSDVTLDTAIGSVDGSVVFDTNITGSDVTLGTSIENVVGNVPISLEADNVGGIDMNLSGSSITQDIDIADMTGDFDVRTFNRGGQAYRRTLSDVNVQITNTTPAWIENTWTVFDPAAGTEASADFLLESMTVRLYDPNVSDVIHQYGPIIEIDTSGTGLWRAVGLQRARSRENVERLSDANDPYVTGGTYDSRFEVVWTVNFPFGLEIQEGQGLRLRFDQAVSTAPNAGNCETDVQCELLFTRRERSAPP